MGERNYWMIGVDGKTYGPTDEATMRRWISERRLTAATQVSSAAEGPWRDASSFEEFAAALGVSPAAAAAPGAAPSVPPAESAPAVPLAADWPPGNLQVVLLVGGIFNLISGVSWLIGGCWCCFLCIPLIIIGIMQCSDYATASTTPPQRYCERAQTWGIVNCCTVLLLNIPSLVCGILQLCWVGDAKRKYCGR